MPSWNLGPSQGSAENKVYVGLQDKGTEIKEAWIWLPVAGATHLSELYFLLLHDRGDEGGLAGPASLKQAQAHSKDVRSSLLPPTYLTLQLMSSNSKI